MAAASTEARLAEVVELSRLAPTDLDSLLATEITVWAERFAWDFRPSAEMLRRFLQMHSLRGYALRSGNACLGYTYYVSEEKKGLIGDFFLRPDVNSPHHEELLLNATIEALRLTSGIRRIESQLMMLQAMPTTNLPLSQYLKRYDRYFMEIGAAAIRELSPGESMKHSTVIPWAEKMFEDAAHLIAASYRGHVDSEINDQYRTIPGSRHFLANIIRYPGCGRFSPDASVAVLDQNSGRICGMSLASMVSANSGHITQLCVLPGVRGSRVGYQALRHSMLQLVSAGCTTVSLTVTCSNVDAIRLYQSVGFQVSSTFPALVWEGF